MTAKQHSKLFLQSFQRSRLDPQPLLLKQPQLAVVESRSSMHMYRLKLFEFSNAFIFKSFLSLIMILCYSTVDCLDVPNYNEIYVSRTPSEIRLYSLWDTPKYFLPVFLFFFLPLLLSFSTCFKFNNKAVNDRQKAEKQKEQREAPSV